MAENKRFQFGGTDEVPDGPLFQEDIKHRRIEKLSRRVTVIIVLLPCLLGLMLYYGYRDLSGRMNRSQDSGVQEVHRLSEEVLVKFDGISAKLDELEAVYTKVAESLQETRDLLDQNSTASEAANATLAASAQSNTEAIKQLGDTLEEVKNNKLDKTELGEIDAKLNTALAPLIKEVAALGSLKEEIEALAPLREEIDSLAAFRQEIEDVSKRLSTLENSLGKDLNAFATYVEKTNKDLDQIQSSMTALSKDKIGQEKLRLELLKVRKRNRLSLLQEITKIQKTMNGIQDKVNKLERASPRSSIIRPPARSQQPAALSQSGEVSEQELTD